MSAPTARSRWAAPTPPCAPPTSRSAAGGSISGAGTVSGLGGGNKTVALTEIDNDGTITAEGGNLLLYGAVEGTGTLGIGNNATLTLQAAVEASQTLTFGNNSKAVLNDVRAFHGTITGFGSDDVLDLAGIQATNPSWGDGVLTLDTPFGQIFLNIAGPYFRNQLLGACRTGLAAPSCRAAMATSIS